jgi:hypothetical protein
MLGLEGICKSEMTVSQVMKLSMIFLT